MRPWEVPASREAETPGAAPTEIPPCSVRSVTVPRTASAMRMSPFWLLIPADAFLESQGLIRRERDERRRERYVVDDDVLYRSTTAGARATAHLGEIARQGVGVLGPGTPAAARLENIARFVDFVPESIARAADQAREILHTKSGAAPDSTA